MEWELSIAIATILGIVGYLVGMKLQPKNRTIVEMNKHYEGIIEQMKKHNHSLQGTVNRMRQGIVPAEAGQGDDVGSMIDAVINALPANYRAIASNFAPIMKKEIANNPELADTIKSTIKDRIMKGGRPSNEEREIARDSI